MTVKEKIIEATLEEFNEKSIKFTMDDLAKRLSISKKTIYALFKDKESLFLETVDYYFDAIKRSEAAILEDASLNSLGKLKQILTVLPERYKHIDWRRIYIGKEKYPNIYKRIEKRLESDWNTTYELIEKCIAEGEIKPVCIPVLKLMIQASMEQFLSSVTLLKYEIPYPVALEEMVKIIFEGIEVMDHENV